MEIQKMQVEAAGFNAKGRLSIKQFYFCAE
jgi:hypothetical protein